MFSFSRHHPFLFLSFLFSLSLPLPLWGACFKLLKILIIVLKCYRRTGRGHREVQLVEGCRFGGWRGVCGSRSDYVLESAWSDCCSLLSLPLWGWMSFLLHIYCIRLRVCVCVESLVWSTLQLIRAKSCQIKQKAFRPYKTIHFQPEVWGGFLLLINTFFQ